MQNNLRLFAQTSGKSFEVKAICADAVSANAIMESNPSLGLIAENDGFIFLAEIKESDNRLEAALKARDIWAHWEENALAGFIYGEVFYPVKTVCTRRLARRINVNERDLGLMQDCAKQAGHQIDKVP